MSGEQFESLLQAISEDGAVRAQTAAFALVTAHDSDVSDVEVGRYLELMADASAGPLADLGQRFATLAEAMKADLSGAADFTREVLQPFRGNEPETRKIVKAARAAAIADVNLDRREEHALVMIGLALGVDANL